MPLRGPSEVNEATKQKDVDILFRHSKVEGASLRQSMKGVVRVSPKCSSITESIENVSNPLGAIYKAIYSKSITRSIEIGKRQLIDSPQGQSCVLQHMVKV